jgi:hypothetical protein
MRPVFLDSTRNVSALAKSVDVAFTAVALSATLLLAGCNLNDSGPVNANAFQEQGPALAGEVHGGLQPIGGATIQLYQVGVGSSAGSYTGMAKPLLTTTVTTAYDGVGSFNITGDYSCATGSEVYITASGGSPTNTPTQTNPNIAEVAALGSCATLKANASTTYIHMNEVSTVAAAYALAQFATTSSFGTALSAQPGVAGTSAPADNIVTSPSNTQGLINAMNTALVLANTFSYSGSATGLSPGSNANGGATAEYWTINTIADVLSSCVNTTPGVVNTPTDGTACGNLYKYTTPTGKTAPADIFQAALYLALYPTNAGVLTGTPAGSNLINLIVPSAPYTPYVNTSISGNVINDWTVAINYVPVATGTTTTLLSSPYYIAVDSVGNVWEYDVNGAVASWVTETDPTGNPVFSGETACAAMQCTAADFQIQNYKMFGSGTKVTIGQQPGNSSPSGIAIDTNNNVWASDRGGSKYNVFFIAGSGTGSTSNGGGSAGSTHAIGYTIGTNYLPVGMAVDGNNYPWFTAYAKSGSGSSVAPNSSCTSQTEPTSGGPQVLGTVRSSVSQFAGPGYAGGSLIAIDAGNPSCTVSTTTLCNTTVYDSLSGSPTTAISGSPFIWIPFNSMNTLPNTNTATFVGHYTTGNGAYTVPGCSSALGFLGSANATLAPTTGITAINPTGSDMIEYGASVRGTAIGRNGVVWTVNNNATDANSTVTSSVQKFTPSYGTAFTSGSFVLAESSPAFSSFTGGGLTAGYAAQNLVLDGSGAPWLTGNVGSGKSTYVVAFSPSGAAVSSGTGIVGATYSNSGGTTVLSRTTGQTSYGIAVDPSGNVWVGDGDEGSTNNTSVVSDSMYEIVGSAVPVVTPLALGVKNGTLATMP